MSGKTSPTRNITILGYGSFILLGWTSLFVPSLLRSLEQEFSVSSGAFALLYFFTATLYTLGSLSGGFLTEKIGRKIVLTGALACIASGLLLQGFASSWELFFSAVLLTGLGSGAIDGGVNSLFMDLYTDKRRAGFMNLLHLFFSIGAFTGPFIIGQLISIEVPWQFIAYGIGIVTLFLGLLFITLKVPSGHHKAKASHQALNVAERSLLPFVALAFAIAFYVASEVGTSNWLVKYLNDVPVALATGTLSLYWFGLALGRLSANWIAHRISPVLFTLICLLGTAVFLVLAVFVPILYVKMFFFFIGGIFSGPVFPMIMVLGGEIYPHRLAALGGSLTAAAVSGSIIYPPLMGIIAETQGLTLGMLGAAFLCVPATLAIWYAKKVSHIK